MKISIILTEVFTRLVKLRGSEDPHEKGKTGFATSRSTVPTYRLMQKNSSNAHTHTVTDSSVIPLSPEGPDGPQIQFVIRYGVV